MNFQIFKRVIALPLSTSENSFLCVLAFHVQRDSNSCFPSYKTIAKVKRILAYAGIISYKHRGDVLTGKTSDEYTFIFDKSIGLNRDKLTRLRRVKFEKELKAIRKKVVNEMAEEAIENKKKKSSALNQPSFSVSDRVKNSSFHKPQNKNNTVTNLHGSEGVKIASHFPPIASKCHV